LFLSMLSFSLGSRGADRNAVTVDMFRSPYQGRPTRPTPVEIAV